MPSRPKSPAQRIYLPDIRGAAQLATLATRGLTSLAEWVHQSVWKTLGFAGGAAAGQTGGITGRVYRSIHGVTDLVGQGVDVALAQLQPWFQPPTDATSTSRQTFLAALNGVLGDRLEADANPLAIPMTLRDHHGVLDWQATPTMPGATGKVLLLVHGLCMSDLQQHAKHRGHEVEHGETLASALGYTPIYARYNSGLHISENGRLLALQLEHLVGHAPVPIEELAVVAYSMGGLVIRSACHYAKQESLTWPDRLQHIVFLGTPHHGAPLERAGNWLDVILGSTPYSAPFAKLTQLRSCGITDLRYGHLLDSDWQDHDRFDRRADTRRPVPLPEGVCCYAVAATRSAQEASPTRNLKSDGLVPLTSAFGLHDDPRRDLGFAKESRWIAHGMGHMDLLSRPEVSQQLVRWLTSTPT